MFHHKDLSPSFQCYLELPWYSAAASKPPAHRGCKWKLSTVWKISILHQTGDLKQSLGWRRPGLRPSNQQAQFKQVRMFVISLTTPVCWCYSWPADWLWSVFKLCHSRQMGKKTAEHSLLKAENSLIYCWDGKRKVIFKWRGLFQMTADFLWKRSAGTWLKPVTHSVKNHQQALNLPVFLASLTRIVPGLLVYAAVT